MEPPEHQPIPARLVTSEPEHSPVGHRFASTELKQATNLTVHQTHNALGHNFFPTICSITLGCPLCACAGACSFSPSARGAGRAAWVVLQLPTALGLS